MSEQEIKDAYVDQQAVELSMGMAIEHPGMYSMEEMTELIGRHDEATEALDEALRADFRAMPLEMRQRMLEMLSKAGDGGRQMLDILDTDQR